MPLALAGSLTAVQFRYPAELPLNLNLNKIEYFSKVSFRVLLGKKQNPPGFDLALKNPKFACKDSPAQATI